MSISRTWAHSGGYSSFSFDITSNLNGGTNELIVHVYDPTELGGTGVNGTETSPHQPYGKQIADSGRGNYLYSSASGIWQTVWLEPVPAASITRLDMTPDIDNRVLRLTVQGTGDHLSRGLDEWNNGRERHREYW